jgi:raffinose/stachyose/melibiose transport system permease protein
MRKNELIWAIIFIAPTAVLFLLVYSIPLVTVISTSLTEWKTIHPPKFIGFHNYIYLFTESEIFKASMLNTLLWIAIASTAHVAFGLSVALVLARRPFGWKAVRVIYFLPNVIPGIAMAFIFKMLFNAEIGVINQLIRGLGFTDFYHNWYGHPRTAFLSVTLIWLFYAGLLTVLILAEYQSIPTSLFESARLDGASSFQIDRYITLPLLKSILGVCVILSVTAMITEFAHVWITTRGGPGYTTFNLALLLYRFTTRQNNYGLANAVGTLQIAMGVLIVFIVTRLTKKEV